MGSSGDAKDGASDGCAEPTVSLVDWLERDEAELLQALERLYVPRNDARWLRRNALVALGNIGDADDLSLLVAAYADGDDAVLRETAAWALERIVERST